MDASTSCLCKEKKYRQHRQHRQQSTAVNSSRSPQLVFSTNVSIDPSIPFHPPKGTKTTNSWPEGKGGMDRLGQQRQLCTKDVHTHKPG